MKNALIGAIYLFGGNKPRPEPTQNEKRRMEAYDKNQKLYTKSNTQSGIIKTTPSKED